MNPSTDVKHIVKHSRRVWKWAVISVIALAAYGWVYFYEPLSFLSDYWNNVAGDTLILIPALAAALLSARLTRHFKPSEPPYRIWLAFTLGWFAWVGGELLGFVYDYYYWSASYPEFTFIDVCWLAGYAFFGLSLYYQFRLIYNHKQERKTAVYFLLIALALLLTLGLTQLALAAGLGTGYSWPALYLAIIYPVFDLFEGGAALWLFFLFERGYLGRPWWGLIAFAVADGISIFFWIGGDKWLSNQTYQMVDLFAAVVYAAGYIISALAFLSANEHIEHGIASNATR